MRIFGVIPFIKGITPKIRMLYSVLINSVISNLFCVWMDLVFER